MLDTFAKEKIDAVACSLSEMENAKKEFCRDFSVDLSSPSAEWVRCLLDLRDFTHAAAKVAEGLPAFSSIGGCEIIDFDAPLDHFGGLHAVSAILHSDGEFVLNISGELQHEPAEFRVFLGKHGDCVSFDRIRPADRELSGIFLNEPAIFNSLAYQINSGLVQRIEDSWKDRVVGIASDIAKECRGAVSMSKAILAKQRLCENLDDLER